MSSLATTTTTNAGSRFVKLFISQLGFKLLSFGLTSLLTRALLPKAKGVGFFFEMYFLAGCFIARESVRSLHARVPLTSKRSFSAILGSGTYCAFVILSLVIPLCLLHAKLTMNSELENIFYHYYDSSTSSSSSALDSTLTLLSSAPSIVIMLSIAMITELLSETHWNLALHYRGGIEDRATGDSTSLLTKTFVTTVGIYLGSYLMSSKNNEEEQQQEFRAVQIATISFAVGQLFYGLSYYINSARTMAKCFVTSSASSTLPPLPPNEFIKLFSNKLAFAKPTFSSLSGALSLYFTAPSKKSTTSSSTIIISENDQVIEKKKKKNDDTATTHDDESSSPNVVMFQFIQENILRMILTEGEKFVSSGVVSLSVQGAFDVASSLGKLVTRILFRLWEDFCFNEWAKGAAEISSLSSSKKNDDKHLQIQQVLKNNLSLLHNMCRLAVIIGILSCCFGPLLSGRILQLLFGSKWANKEAADILAVYLLSLPLFGLNGLVEAFCRAMGSPAEMKRAKIQLLIVSCFYLVGAYSSLRYFSDGDIRLLIVVNSIQFVLRIGIGLVIVKGIVDRLSSSSSSSSWISFLKPFCPSIIFLAVSFGIALVGNLFISPYSRRFDFEQHQADESPKYIVPFKKDLLLIGLGIVSAIVALVTEPEVVMRIRGFISRRRGGDSETRKEKEE